jgi:hypothetical protein
MKRRAGGMAVHTIILDKVEVQAGEILSYHLRNLARVQLEIQVEVSGRVTIDTLLDAVDARYPMLKGTIRENDH